MHTASTGRTPAKPRLRLILALDILLLAVPFTARAQQHQHLIRGRVTTDSGAALPSADIIVTVAPTTQSISGKSDSSGRYRIVIPNPTGEYLIYITALGRRPLRRRVTIGANDSTAVVDAQLPLAVTRLVGVRVQGQRARAPRSLETDRTTPTNGNNHLADGVTNALPPELQGNFDAMAALIPGLAVTANGVSAFGLGSDANMTTLNGMSFGGGSVPRDLPTSATFFTSPWDPTRGGFSGVLTSATVSRGDNITHRRAHLTFDSPSLQLGDPIAEHFGQKFTNIQLSDARSGALSLDKYFYTYAIQASRQTANVSSLLDVDADALAHAGVSADSVRQLVALLQDARIPLAAGGVPRQRMTRSIQFLERFDRALPAPSPAVAPPPAFDLLVGANYADSRGLALSPTTLPTTTGKSFTGGGFLQGQYIRNFGRYGAYTNETSLGFSYADTIGSPYLALPGANVLIASSLAGSDPTLASLSFGGNGLLTRNTRKWAWEANNQTDFLINDHPSLPAKLYFQSRYERYDQSLPANRLGSFNYASLSDVASNTPSSFSRTLNASGRAGGEWIGAAAAGASYSTSHWDFSGGARIDANAFTGLPVLNPGLISAFGVHNNESPSSIAVSPRLGFNWYPVANKSLDLLAGSSGRILRGSYSLRGGIGEFRSFLPATLLSDAIGTTGLPGSAERLACVGPAAPTPDWQSYIGDPSRIPATCNGASGVFADTVPNATFVDRSYTPSRVWRATLGWTNTILGNYLAVDGVYSLNLNQPGNVDVNFAGVRRFALADEGSRPVFVSAPSIVPSTGALSSVESRRSDAFGRVVDRVSDLRGDTRQLTVYGIPNIPIRAGIFTLGYTYAQARAQQRGFDGSTSSDPRAIEWAPQAFTPRHQFVLQGAKALFGGALVLTASGRAMSGLRYTPTVAGDVNGDGVSGDRAFIFDPARVVADPSFANGLQDLIQHGSASARACLSPQTNSLAGRNSCVGPWSATMNMNLFMPNVPRTDERVQASINFANPLGGLDQVLHGSSHLHGWGSAPVIDGTLYQVRGFEPATQRFVYAINPRFGNANPAFTTFRTPFRVTLDVRVDYGHSAAEQGLDLNLRIKPPLVGTRATADTIKARYMTAGFMDVYKIMLRFSDSLALTRAQGEQMQVEERALVAKADTIYGALARQFAALPPDYDVADAVRQLRAANDQMWGDVHAEAPFIRRLLTAGQQRRLPYGVREMVTTENYKGRFFYRL
jgi:hypothetical protein